VSFHLDAERRWARGRVRLRQSSRDEHHGAAAAGRIVGGKVLSRQRSDQGFRAEMRESAAAIAMIFQDPMTS